MSVSEILLHEVRARYDLEWKRHDRAHTELRLWLAVAALPIAAIVTASPGAVSGSLGGFWPYARLVSVIAGTLLVVGALWIAFQAFFFTSREREFLPRPPVLVEFGSRCEQSSADDLLIAERFTRDIVGMYSRASATNIAVNVSLWNSLRRAKLSLSLATPFAFASAAANLFCN